MFAATRAARHLAASAGMDLIVCASQDEQARITLQDVLVVQSPRPNRSWIHIHRGLSPAEAGFVRFRTGPERDHYGRLYLRRWSELTTEQD